MIRTALQLLRLAAGLPRYLREPLTGERALEAVRALFAERERRFVAIARRLVFDVPGSPYLPLFAKAGCTAHDLEREVETRGLDATLTALARAGVRVALADFKRRAAAFDNPLFDAALESETGGSRSAGTRVGYDWRLVREHAATERVLNDLHGIAERPLVLWLPPLPSIAGMQYVLMNLSWGRVPARWFTPARRAVAGRASRHVLANAYVLALCRVSGRPVPRPEVALFDDARRVAQAVAARRPCVLRSYASSAARVARAARDAGLDLRGCVFLTGGEPLTDERRAIIEATGAAALTRYSSTEAGLMGATCPHRESTDDMHLYEHRLAAIDGGDALLFTSLSAHAGKVLINVDLGDGGRLSRRECACALGAMGMTLRVRNVRSTVKLTAEGMNALLADLDALVVARVTAAGGTADDVQYRETTDEHGIERLEIAVDPSVADLDGAALERELLADLASRHAGGALAADLWRRAGTLRVLRVAPVLTPGTKLRRVLRVSGEPRPGAT